MKVLLSFFIITCLLFACRSKDKSPSKSNDLLADKFKSFLNGTWVPAAYIDNIVKTKSPLKSSDKLEFISEMIIDMSGKSSDSIHVRASLGNHEGSDYLLYFKQEQKPTVLMTAISDFDTDTCKLDYDIRGKDTFLLLYRYDQHKKLIGKTKYVKVTGKKPNDDIGSGLQCMVNKKLISGTYKVTDPAGKEFVVKMTDDGKISGFKGLKTYYILTDFAAEPGNMTDEICFEIQTKDQKCYGFKIIADTINLFEPAKDEQDTLFTPGQTIYRFVKQK